MIPMHSHLKSELVAGVAAPTALGAAVYALTFTASDITAMTVAMTALVAAIGAVIVNIMTARAALKKADLHDRKIDVATEKLNEGLAQGKTIEGHVNSAASASQEKIRSLETVIQMLREDLLKQDRTAERLAAAQAPPGPTNADIMQKLTETIGE